VPIIPDVGDMPVIERVTVNVAGLLGPPFTVTITFPEVAPAGTGTVIEVWLQVEGVAATPLNVTVLVPCDDPKLAPVMVTLVPARPEVGFRLVMLGDGRTVKFNPLLFTPDALTTTFPVVAPGGTVATIELDPQFPMLAIAPLNITVPVPCDAPKFDPVIVTGTPAGAEVTDKLVMLGAGTTVNAEPLLA
jgi:hypothetical protein